MGLLRSISEKIYRRLCEVIPGGVNSPVRAFKSVNQAPMIVEYGDKDCLYDADGHCYIDYCGSWGALILGHTDKELFRSVYNRLVKGSSFGVTTAIEEQLARLVTEMVKSVERIRFVSSGTEATMSAVRVARGFTQREYIVKFIGNYHGHADLFLVNAGSGVLSFSEASSDGIPKDSVKQTLNLPYNDIKAVRKLFQSKRFQGKIAAVIVEPIAANMGVVPSTLEFIQMLREETAKDGALLIFDEVITGFRVGPGGAQEFYGVKPDLTCFGKILGGGFPAAAFGGRQDVMECLAPQGRVYQAGTLSGNPVAMEAGFQTLQRLQQKDFYEILEQKTQIITEPVREKIKSKKLNACLQGRGSMFTLFFGCTQVSNMDDVKKLDLEKFGQFFRFMFDNGVYVPPSQHESWFVSIAHQEENLIKTRDLILRFLDEASPL